MNFEYTPWFSTDDAPPVRPGPYELARKEFADEGESIAPVAFAFFDESLGWMRPRQTIEDAVASDALIPPPEGVKPYGMFWRGLRGEDFFRIEHL